ncbi:MAG: LamG-like jellyroll fold domain-containing protein, partial [Crocosphaera sp.]
STPVCIEWGQWHHLAITNDGKLSSIYVDGELKKQTPTEGVYDDENLSEILIGKHLSESYPIEFKGWITEVRLWNKARSGEEIKENMSRCLSGNETGLVGYWPLVKALTATNIAIDKSPNENNGKINGASIAKIELPSSFAKAQLNAEERWAHQNQDELNKLQVTLEKAKEEANIARKEKAAKEDEIKILNDKIKTLKDQLAAKGGTEHTEVVKAAPPKQVTLHEGDNFDENKDPFLPGDHSLGRSPKTSTTGLEDYARWKTLFQDHEQDPNAKPFRRGRIWS